jgi:hypothetical protein
VKKLRNYIVCMLLILGMIACATAVSVKRPAAALEQGTTQAASEMSTPELIAAAYARGEISEQQQLLYLAFALSDYARLPQAYRGSRPWSGTAVLRELQEYAAPSSSLDRPTARTIAAVLGGHCGASEGLLPGVAGSKHFYIEHDEIAGGLTVADYSAALEQVWELEIEQFGWAEPPVFLGNPPPDGRYHVRIAALADPSLFGYVSSSGYYANFVGNNPHTSWNDVDAFATCMVLTNDFSRFYVPAQTMLDATVAHEFNHSIQFGYGAATGSNAPDIAFAEGGSTWMTAEVFPDNDIEQRYLWPAFERCMGSYQGSPYYYWLTFRGLTERFGVGMPGGGEQVMQDFWELTSQSEHSNMLSALDAALANKGSSLPAAFHEYAITLRFAKPCPAAAPFCFAEAKEYVNAAGKIANNGRLEQIGSLYSGSLEDNYAINYVELPKDGTYAIEFENSSGGGEFKVSIVADLGSELQIKAFPNVIGANAVAVLPAYSAPAGAARVIAVITNQHQTADNPTSCKANPYRLGVQSVNQTFIFLPLIKGS